MTNASQSGQTQRLKYAARWRAEQIDAVWCVVDDSTGKRICTVSPEWVAQKMIGNLLASAPGLRERNEELELQNRLLRELINKLLRFAQVDIQVREPLLRRVLAGPGNEKVCSVQAQTMEPSHGVTG